MKKQSSSSSSGFGRTLFILCALMALLGFFLSWVRPGSKFDPKLASLAKSLKDQTDAPLGWEDFLLLSKLQQRAALDEPFEGVNGYNLWITLTDEPEKEGIESLFVGQLASEVPETERAWFPVVLPVLVIFSCVIGMGTGAGTMPRLVGIALLLLYGFLRWRLVETEGTRLALDLRIGLGFWIVVYSALVSGLWLFIRSFIRK